MVNRNKIGNSADAKNDTAVLQEVNINIGGGTESAGSNNRVNGSGGDCYGMCYQCSKSPAYCAIARQHLPAEEYFNYGG